MRSDGDVLSPPAGRPTLDYLLTLGPYVALVCVVFLLGKGVKITVQVTLSQRARELLVKVGERGGA